MNLRSCYGKSAALLLLTFVISLNTMAQRVAVKTNLLYDATLTPNVGIELGMGRKHTLQGFYSLNLWKKPSATTVSGNTGKRDWNTVGGLAPSLTATS